MIRGKAKQSVHPKPSSVMSAIGAVTHENTVTRNRKRVEAVPNNSWDDVQHLSMLCVQLLMTGSGLMPALNNRRLVEQVDNKVALQQEVTILAGQLPKFSANLKALRERHQDKSGNAQGPDENMQAIALYSEYTMWTEQFEALVQPGINHIVELIQKAESKLMDEDSSAAEAIAVQTSDMLDNVKTISTPVEDPQTVSAEASTQAVPTNPPEQTSDIQNS